MMGDRIAFSFTAVLMVIIFIVIVVSVRDNKKATFSSSVDAVRMPTKADDHIAVDLAMNKEPYSVHDTDTIREVAQILTANKTSGVPVVDNENKVVAYF